MPSRNVENAATMEAKMTVATSRDHCQQLKDMLSKEDPSSMVLVVASGIIQSPKPRSAPVVMDPGLLAVACTGSWKELQSFLNGDPRPSSGDGDPWSMEWTIKCCCCVWRKRQSSPPHPTSSDGSSTIQPPPLDQEALPRVSLLDGVTIEGDTFLHVMATNSAGEDLVEDGVGLIRSKAVQFLSRSNNNEDTPLHCAARAAKPRMVSLLVELARGGKDDAVKELLKKQNKSGWTALHEAVRAGNNDIVSLLMTENPELASFPKHATSPMYLAILMENETIARTLHEKSSGVLSYSGPKGQNALHAAVLRSKDLTKLLLGWKKDLTVHQDENGSTPLHLAASMPLESDIRTMVQFFVVETIPDTSEPGRKDRRTIQLLLLEANPDALYQPDHDGLFPIHVAASVGATFAINDFLEQSPSCAGLRDARGRTFLHVAADKMKIWTVKSACRNQSLSWILNMQDSDGNTALHLAVQKGSLRMFCALLENWKVQMNLTNKEGETPRDIARRSLPEGGLYYTQNSEAIIQESLDFAGAKRGICRQDCFDEDDTEKVKQNETRRIKMLKEGTSDLCIGAVLIATVTFGATFAMPGGYRADDHANGGTPTLAGGYVFDAFVLANAIAFASSAMATISLICSGSPMHNVRTRIIYLKVAFSLMTLSVTSLVAAFALGTYMMLAPVARKVAVPVCVLSSLVLLYPNVEVVIKSTMVRAAHQRRKRMRNYRVFLLAAFNIVGTFLYNLSPIMVIFGLTALNYTRRKVEPAAAQPPAPYYH